MTLSTRIAPFLPYLRRYSRALTGSQTSGDAYVAAVLEALIADTSIFPEASSDRVALFRLFTSMFGSSSVLVPEPVSPPSRSRAWRWDTGAGADVGQTCRNFTSAGREPSGAGRIRTRDTRVKSPLL